MWRVAVGAGEFTVGGVSLSGSWVVAEFKRWVTLARMTFAVMDGVGAWLVLGLELVFNTEALTHGIV